MITIKQAKGRGKVYQANELPAYVTETEMVWTQLGVNEDYNVTLHRAGNVTIERVFWDEDAQDWDGDEVKNEDIAEEIVIYKP